MNRMNIITRVAHTQPISLTLLQMKHGGSRFACHWIRHAVNRPPIEAFFCSIVFGECHLESLIGLRSGRSRFRKARIVPLEGRRSKPLRFSSAARVLHYDPHAVAAIIVCEVTENPDTRMRHVYGG